MNSPDPRYGGAVGAYHHYAKYTIQILKQQIKLDATVHSDWLIGAGGHTIGDLYILYSVYAKTKTQTAKPEEKKWKQKNEVEIKRNTHEMK